MKAMPNFPLLLCRPLHRNGFEERLADILRRVNAKVVRARAGLFSGCQKQEKGEK